MCANCLAKGVLLAIGVVGATIAIRCAIRRMITTSARKCTPLLRGNEVVSLEIAEKLIKTHDTFLLRFRVDYPKEILGLPVGNHVRFLARINGKEVQRSYTPVTLDHVDETIDFIIKVYPNGLMSRYLQSKQVGERVAMKGPLGSIFYKGNGLFEVSQSFTPTKPNMVRRIQSNHIQMIAGGTGITPILQVIRCIMNDPEDHTSMHLIYANKTERDIIMRDELDTMANDPHSNLKVYYVLSDPSPEWTQGAGYVDNGVIGNRFVNDFDKSPIVLLCGPPAMVTFMKKCLTEFNLDHDKVLRF